MMSGSPAVAAVYHRRQYSNLRDRRRPFLEAARYRACASRTAATVAILDFLCKASACLSFQTLQTQRLRSGLFSHAASRLARTSENQLQRELDLSRGRGRICNDPTRRAVIAARENNLIRVREIGVIQNIERLGAELHIQSLADSYPLQERRVDIEQARTTQRSARHVAEGALDRQHEGSRIEPLIRSPQNYRPLKIRIPVGYVGITVIAGPRSIGASQRREGESARNPEAAIPLPAADQLVHDPSGAACEALPIPKRQLIAGIRVELMGEAVGSHAPVQPAIIGAIKFRWLVSGGRRQDGGIVIHDFSVGVIRLKSEPTARALGQRDIQTMVARGPLIEPLSAAADVGIWPCPRWVIYRSLRY